MVKMLSYENDEHATKQSKKTSGRPDNNSVGWVMMDGMLSGNHRTKTAGRCRAMDVRAVARAENEPAAHRFRRLFAAGNRNGI